MMIHIMRMKVSPGSRAAAVRTIAAMTGLTRSKSGCLACDLYSHVDKDDELQLVEKWDSVESLKRHIGSEQYGFLVEALELAIERPEVEFHTVTTTMGLPFVEDIRLLNKAKIK
jgi:quinol monooxygenase YgiN